MLEKDIENLLARYPEEFFPELKLKPVGQQVKLGSYSADVIFQNQVGDTLIVEVKRGILSREAVGQIMDYYGMLKYREPDKSMHLMLVANVIPRERVVYLKEIGISCVEIPVSKIWDVAKKHSYRFLDAEKPELRKKYKETATKLDERVGLGESRVWIFQANPRRYDILNALADDFEEDVWAINQYKGRIHNGDIGIIWMSGKEGGIYAIADVVSDPEYLVDSEASTKYWTSEADKSQKRLRVRIRYRLKLINNPIMRDELRNIPELKNTAIFKQPQGTNFPVSSDEWEIISGLIKERFVEC